MKTRTSLPIVALLVAVSVPAERGRCRRRWSALKPSPPTASPARGPPMPMRRGPCGTALPFSKVRNTINLSRRWHVRTRKTALPTVRCAQRPQRPRHLTNARSVVGTWSFDPSAHQYEMSVRFDWYVSTACTTDIKRSNAKSR